MPAAFHRPTELADALAIAARAEVTPAAGCTDLFPATKTPVLPGAILDLSGVAALRGIARADGHVRIGATTTWTEILNAPLPPAFDGLKQAAREVGSVQIQNAGTIAGNLCNASPAADGVPPLLTLDAQVELASAGGTRRLALSDFILGPRRTALARGELLTAVLIPDAQGQGAFLKLGARRFLVISIAMTAARVTLDGDRIAGAALAVGACSPVAVRLPAQEAALRGLPADRAAAAIDPGLIAPALAPIDDPRADAAYRAHAAAELIARTLAGALTPRERAA